MHRGDKDAEDTKAAPLRHKAVQRGHIFNRKYIPGDHIKEKIYVNQDSEVSPLTGSRSVPPLLVGTCTNVGGTTNVKLAIRVLWQQRFNPPSQVLQAPFWF